MQRAAAAVRDGAAARAGFGACGRRAPAARRNGPSAACGGRRAASTVEDTVAAVGGPPARRSELRAPLRRARSRPATVRPRPAADLAGRAAPARQDPVAAIGRLPALRARRSARGRLASTAMVDPGAAAHLRQLALAAIEAPAAAVSDVATLGTRIRAGPARAGIAAGLDPREVALTATSRSDRGDGQAPQEAATDCHGLFSHRRRCGPADRRPPARTGCSSGTPRIHRGTGRRSPLRTARHSCSWGCSPRPGKPDLVDSRPSRHRPRTSSGPDRTSVRPCRRRWRDTPRRFPPPHRRW